eukprot:PhM_4_TR5864/c0_g1_i1/m.19491/K07393/ECM4, yqjG; glutathionyl-hydroquinone reductase
MSVAAKTALADVSKAGNFVRKASVFRNEIKAGGMFPPAAGRYLLYVAYACPWASRCLAVRNMKGLEDAIDVAVASPVWGYTKKDVDDHRGWLFDAQFDSDCTADPVFGSANVRGVYEEAIKQLGEEGKGIDTRFTVPILFDKETKRIVNNESSEIMRFFNTAFNDFARHPEVDLYPEALRGEIDAMNDANYESVNNGVYKCGFAQTQSAYDDAAVVLFNRLRELDELLSKHRYLLGGTVTEADIRLFVTIVRYDEVYVVHFKCNGVAIRDLPNLFNWMKDVYQTCRLAPSVHMKHIKHHYYRSHESINKFGIVPIGPNVDLASPHGRDVMTTSSSDAKI